MRNCIRIGVGFPSTPAPTPGTIFGGQVLSYVDADFGVDPGAGTWTDTANGHVFTAINSPTYSATGLDGHGTFSYVRGSSQRHQNSTIVFPAPGTSPTTILAVVRQNAWVSTAALFGATGANAFRILQTNASPNLSQNNGSSVNENTAATIAAWVVLIAIFRNSAGAEDSLRLGSTTVATGNSGNTAATGCQIAANNGGAHCSMSIAQRVDVAGVPTTEQLDAWLSYVGSRYPSVVQ